MKSKFVMSSLLLVSFIASIFSADIQFQRVLNTEAYNNGIVQDKDGFIWISSEFKGLFYYNGNSLRNIKIGDNSSIQIISSIFADREGLIWFFIEGQGLYCYNGQTDSFKSYNLLMGNYNASHAIAQDKDGLIWIGTTEGLSCYNKKTNRFVQYKNNPDDPNSLSNNNVWVVVVDHEERVWAGTDNGLNCYNKDTNMFSCYRHDPNKLNSISENCIRAISEDKDGNIWIGTKNTGIDKFDKKTSSFKNYRHNNENKNSLSCNEIHQLMVDRYNSLWICNEGNTGLDIYNIKTNTFQHYSYDPEDLNTVNSNNRLCTFEDSSGNVWVIDSSGGVTKCIRQKNVFRNYIHAPDDPFSISSNNIAKIYEDKKGNIWIGTYRGGLCLYTQNDKFKKFTRTSDPFSLPGSSIHSILDASDNKLWMGVKQGFLCLFDTDTNQVVKKFQNPYLKLTPEYLTQDNKNPNILWFACCYMRGLFNFNTITEQFTEYKHDPSDKNSISNEVTCGILQDGDILWISTGGDGLCKFDKNTGKCKYYKHDSNNKNSISSNIVLESFIDSKGNFWVTTDDGGLNKLDRQRETFTNYSIEAGFPSKSARHILEDNNGYLWVGTDFGIVKFDPKNEKVIRLFTTSDGLLSNQFNRLPYPLKDSKGNLWFAGFGLSKFNPEEVSEIESNHHIPSVVLSLFKSKEGVCIKDGIKKIENITLSWPDNSFEFAFAVLDYKNPRKNQHAYKLEKFDKKWHYVGKENFGAYTNIPPGEYILRLKGSNDDGLWNEQGMSIQIVILSPFWMTWWARALVAILIFVIILIIIHLRTKAIRERAIFMRDHAAQVAHDIRSPLAALNTVLRDLKELPEQKRILIRNATHRISDIANNLLVKYKAKGNLREWKNQRNIQPELVSSLLEYLISEKRLQMTDKSIDLVLDLDHNTYGSFVNLESESFKRVISNLINNAVEAITNKGIIRICLNKNIDNDLIIKITDNGIGIPEKVLPKISQGGFSFGKNKGCGLGIAGAIKHIKNWNGSYNIQSQEGKGTTFTITLPTTDEPYWFQSAIVLCPTTRIVILDDDESIHNIWQSHFLECNKNNPIELKHFYDALTFAEFYKKHRTEHELFLMDYELINSKKTGLDLIESLDLTTQSILVTSRYEELELRERVKNLGIKIIPKSFAPYIPISMEIGNIAGEQPDIILIDDDIMITDIWKEYASSFNKKIAVFHSSVDFKKVMKEYNKDIPIYIDSDLKEKQPGEIFAKFLYQNKFQNLYLTTGYERDRFNDMPWIKDIVNKEPSF